MTNVLFFHTQFSGYFLSSLIFAVEKDEKLYIHIVVSQNTKDAPFKFDEFHERIKVYNRNEFDREGLDKLIKSVSPVSIFLGGWSDREYLQVIKKYKGKISLSVAMDNIWYGRLRQYSALIISRFYLVTLFDFIWVPGKPQLNYARKLGFAASNILSNYYCADVDRFMKYYDVAKIGKERSFPHKFLFVGRYVKEKGIVNLVTAFEQLKKEFPNDWELVCVGTGPLLDSIPKNDAISHHGFMLPDDLQQLIIHTGVFILPSIEEHWGVVLHEYATAGYPIICSKEVGAVGAFLEDELNGFVFDSQDVESLKDKMLKIINLSDAGLLKMGLHSIELSKTISKEKWYESFLIINQKYKRDI